MLNLFTVVSAFSYLEFIQSSFPESDSLLGVSNLLVSLDYTRRRRVVLGHTMCIYCDIWSQKNFMLFQVNFQFFVGLHSERAWATCIPRATGWAPALDLSSIVLESLSCCHYLEHYSNVLYRETQHDCLYGIQSQIKSKEEKRHGIKSLFSD